MRSLILLLVVLILGGCAQKLPVKEYLKWVEDEKNGLLIKESINQSEVILQYQPIDYVALMNQKQRMEDQRSFKTEVDGLDGYYYFSFKIKPSIPVNANQDYFNYLVENRFSLIQGSDSVKCAFFHQESTRNFSPYLTFLLAFKKDNNFNGNLIFQYDDEFLGLSTIKIEINKSSLKKIPSLKFE